MTTPGRKKQWEEHLESVRHDRSLPEVQRQKVLEVWREIEGLQPDILIPSAGKDGDDFYLGWNSRERSLDLVVKSDGSVTWFFSSHPFDLSVSSDECGPEAYKAFLPTLSRTTREDIEHMESGCKAWAARLGVEKMCGMNHSDETNAWIAAEKERSAR